MKPADAPHFICWYVLVFGTGQGEAKLVLFEARTILLFDACVELIAEEENRS